MSEIMRSKEFTVTGKVFRVCIIPGMHPLLIAEFIWTFEIDLKPFEGTACFAFTAIGAPSLFQGHSAELIVRYAIFRPD